MNEKLDEIYRRSSSAMTFLKWSLFFQAVALVCDVLIWIMK